MFKKGIGINNLQWLTCHKTKPNRNKPERLDFQTIDTLLTAVHAKCWSEQTSFSTPLVKGTFKVNKGISDFYLLLFNLYIYSLHYIFHSSKIRYKPHTHTHTHTYIRSTTSQILTIRRILEGVRAKNLQATLIFVDFTKAFDSIHRGKMEQILLAYGIPKETVAAITILYRNTKVKVRSPDGDTEYFDIVAGVLQGDTLAPYLFIICLDYVLRTSIDKIKENGFELTKKRSRRYPATTITDADYADDIAILANTPDQAETLLHSLERAAASIGLYVNAHKTEYMCYNQTGDISTLEGTPLKLVDKFTYLGSSVESTEKDIETRLTKAWTAINRLSIIWKSDLTDKMKRSFFQAAVTSILLYGCTTWTLTKRLEKKLDGNYTRMLRAILNKSWQQHPTRHQLYGHLPPITKTIQVRRTRHAGHCWRSRDELIRDVLLWIPTHGRAKAGRPARTYIQQLCEDTGCCPEDLPRAMNDREEWRERVRDIRATSAIWWWWWWWYTYILITFKYFITFCLFKIKSWYINSSKNI